VSHTEDAETRIRDELAAIVDDSDAHAEKLRTEAGEKSSAEDADFQEHEAGAYTRPLSSST